MSKCRFPQVCSSSKALVLGFALTTLLAVAPLRAESNTHGSVISTWDTRAASVAANGYGNALGRFHGGSFHANFSSASGEASAQFGFHYANLRFVDNWPVQQGIGASAALLWTFPSGSRWSLTQPKAAFAAYAGLAPSAYLRGQRNTLTLPLPIGAGVPLAPVQWLTLTPWVEVSPALNLDTAYAGYTAQNRPGSDFLNGAGELELQPDEVRLIGQSAIEYESSFAVGLRGGLAAALRFSDSVDLNVTTTAGSLGAAFSGEVFLQLGAGLVVRWGDVPGNTSSAGGSSHFYREPGRTQATPYPLQPGQLGPYPLQQSAPSYPNQPAPTPSYPNQPPLPAPSYPVQQPAPAPNYPVQQPAPNYPLQQPAPAPAYPQQPQYNPAPPPAYPQQPQYNPAPPPAAAPGASTVSPDGQAVTERSGQP